MYLITLLLLEAFGIIALMGLGHIELHYPSTRASATAERPPSRPPDNTLEQRYLHLLKRHLTRYDFGKDYKKVAPFQLFDEFLESHQLALMEVFPDSSYRAEGRDWQSSAETMIGLKRLDNLEFCIRSVIDENIPGDLIEAGAWRGGSTIFMRAALDAYGDQEKNVWVADSFEGLPKPDEGKYPADTGDTLWMYDDLAVSVDKVKENFEAYGLLDDRVKFLKGWFKDSLPDAPIESLAIARIDADMYQSTTEALQYLYPKVVPGGYVIVDDFGAIEACAKAVLDYRTKHGITEEIVGIDWTGVYWRKN